MCMTVKWTEKRRERLSDDLDLLLGELCRNWGFCVYLSGQSLLAKHDPIAASDFAAAVLHSEGMDAGNSPWRGEIEKAFTARYGKLISSKDYEAAVSRKQSLGTGNYPDGYI